MTNSYYNKGGTYSRGTTARAETVESDFAAVEDGFDLLPAPTALHGDSFNYSTDTGTANAYAVTVSGGPASPTAGTTVKFFAANANTGASTLTYTGSSAWSAKGLRRNNGDALVSGDIRAGQLVEATYNGSYFAINAVAYGEISDAIAAGESIGPSLTDIQTLADIEDGTVATNAISGLASISGNVTTVSGISENVTTVAGISADVTAVAGGVADIGTVATNIANVNTAATNIVNINTVADDAVDIGTVAVISANVTTVAGDSADIQALAAITSNINTVAVISANVTTVANDATDIGTVATNIADVTTCATNIADIQDAANLFGDVVQGPGSSTDNYVPRWNGTEGDTLKAGLAVGTSANNLVQLDGSSRLPAVDGSQLTGIVAGGLTLIDEQEISTAVSSVEWTSLATGTYNSFLVEIVEASLSATGYLRIQLSPDAGSTWRTTGYLGESVRSTTILSDTTGLATTPVNNNLAAEVQSGRFIVLEMASATEKTQMRGIGSYTSSGAYRSTVATYQYDTAETHDSIRVIANTGNIDAGTFRLYGVN